MNRYLIRLPIVFVLVSILIFSCDAKHQNLPESSQKDLPTEYKFTRGGAPLEVIVQLSTKELDLTDYLTVTIEARYKEGVRITPPYLSEDAYSPLELVESPKSETSWSESDQVMVSRWSYKFEPFQSGTFTLKSLSIPFRLEKEKKDNIADWPIYQITTDPIAYSVKSVDIGQLDDIKDIKGIIYPPYQYWIPITTIVVLLVLSATIILIIRLRQNRVVLPQSTHELIDYYHESLQRLEELEKKDLISRSEFDVFHTELTTILRDYLEHHLRLRAREKTSEEFIQEMAYGRRFTKEQQEILERFLQLADLVKFATFQPGSGISEEALNNVRRFIHNTGKSDEV